MFVDQNQIEQLVGTKIKNLSLYQRAFTHKSALKEYENLTESFETLEFMGDSVLGFIITKFLFDRFEERQEGFLTKARTKLVRSETLADIALKLGLNKLVLMDEKGMPETGGIIIQRSWKMFLKPSWVLFIWIWVSFTQRSLFLESTMTPISLI
jgi:dsRNA-specific ribonuclease